MLTLLSRNFILLFVFASLYLIVEGLVYHIPGQVCAASMLLAASIYTILHRSARLAWLVNRNRMRMAA